LCVERARTLRAHLMACSQTHRTIR
jgi:hypothetical protein